MRSTLPLSSSACFLLVVLGCGSSSNATPVSDSGVDATHHTLADAGRDVAVAHHDSAVRADSGKTASHDAKAEAAHDAGRDAPADAALPVGAITIVDGKLCRDGECPWVPKGMIFVAFVCPLTGCAKIYRTAAADYGDAGNDLPYAIETFHLDTIRFNFSEYALDPESTVDSGGGVIHFDPAYVAAAGAAVERARGLGMTVIVTMQAEVQATGGGSVEDGGAVPTPGTNRAWHELLTQSSIGSDPGVVLEVFNEPANRVQQGDAAWPEWQTQESSVVQAIRSAGAQNVLLIDGLNSSHVLAGAPSLGDSGPLGYAIHAFPVVDDTLHYDSPAGWDRYFGAFCADAGRPCVVDAWYTGPRDSPAICFPHGSTLDASSPVLTQELFQYLSARSIGLVGFAYDIPGYYVVSLDAGATTTFSNFTGCDGGAGGPGAMTAAYFADGSTQIQ
jgi:Cellulase (glycosyl hydrolase family 5)